MTTYGDHLKNPHGELEDLEAPTLPALKPGWDSYAGTPPTPRALRVVSVLLSRPQIVPCSDGGIQLEWHRDGVDVELGIGPGGEAESLWVGVEDDV